MRVVAATLFFAMVCAASSSMASSDALPACRLDDSMKGVVLDTVTRSAATYNAIGKTLPFTSIQVNGNAAPAEARVLRVYVVKDATAASVDSHGCPVRTPQFDDPLDSLSVRGGCVIVAIDQLELRCSSTGVKIFGDIGHKTGRANPALLYVLSHELGHLYQRRLGEYSGRADTIELARTQAEKVQALRDACDPVLTRQEEEADAMAVAVLARLLPLAPYREPVFSEQGSLFWNIDQLALASDAWQKATLEREFISRPKVHASFVPTQFPTPRQTVALNAKRFVCDVLTKQKGSVLYPGKSTTHPPVEQRLRLIAEALRPVAQQLPAAGGQRGFEAVARLKEGLSPILTHIYRETGVYMEAVQNSICTMVNAPQPQTKCH